MTAIRSELVGAKPKGTTKLVLDILGVVLLGLPLLAPALFALRGGGDGGFHFDFLIPFELFPATFSGILLILVVATWAKLRRGLVWWSFGAAVVSTAAVLIYSVVSGIAEQAPENKSDWRLVMMDVGFGIAWVGMLVLLVAGILIAVDLNRGRRMAAQARRSLVTR